MRVDAPSGPRLAAIAIAAAFAAALTWALWQPSTADLAAQVYRARLFSDHGWVLWDNSWFAGHSIPGYSLLSPIVMSVLGVSGAGLLAAVVTTAAFSRAAWLIAPDRWTAAAAWVAWAATSDLLVGRVTYALGQACAALCVVALLERRPSWVSIALATACAALSPVAALLLVLVLVAVWSASRERKVIAPAVCAGVVTVANAAAFSDGGVQPFGASAALVALGLTLACRELITTDRPILRRVLAWYALAIAGSFLVPGPMGSNVSRLGVMILVPALCIGRPANMVWRPALVAVAAAVWLLFAPVTEVAKTFASDAGAPAYYAPLIGALQSTDVDQGRLEVVPSATRWEVVRLRDRALLARGWETQLDRERNAIFYGDALTASAYVAWLRHNAVRYVALSDAPKERWGRDEARLIGRGVPGLTEVWHGERWRLFRVDRARALATNARILQVQPDSITLDVPRPGPIELRVHWSRYLGAKGACIARTSDGFIALQAARAGRLEVTTHPPGTAIWRCAA